MKFQNIFSSKQNVESVTHTCSTYAYLKTFEAKILLRLSTFFRRIIKSLNIQEMLISFKGIFAPMNPMMQVNYFLITRVEKDKN
jgi:hypothetical protein